MENKIKIKGQHFTRLYSALQIQALVVDLSTQINKDLCIEMGGQSEGFQNDVIFVIVLNGSFFFSSDLIKNLVYQNPYLEHSSIDFVKYSSYQSLQSSGKVESHFFLDNPKEVEGKVVIILEEIVETGETLEKIMTDVKKWNPLKIKVGTLFLKPQSYQKSFPIEYVGANIANKFIIGYGMDYQQQGRLLADIYSVE